MNNSTFHSLNEAYLSIYEGEGSHGQTPKSDKAYNSIYQLDEISLTTKINAYRAAKDFDADYAYGSKVHDQADRIRSKIEKKHGKSAAQHADDAADVRNFGRVDASGNRKGYPKPRIEKNSWRTTKSGKMNKTDQNTLKRKLQTRRNQNEEFIIDYLLDEGFVNNEVSAEVFIEHMSDEWLDDILEGYKDLPVGKMMKKAISRTRREGEAGSRLAREYDSYGPNSSDEKIDKLHKEWDKTQRDADKNDKMIDVADKHNPYKVQGKEKENKGRGSEWFTGR